MSAYPVRSKTHASRTRCLMASDTVNTLWHNVLTDKLRFRQLPRLSG